MKMIEISWSVFFNKPNSKEELWLLLFFMAKVKREISKYGKSKKGNFKVTDPLEKKGSF